MFVVVGVCNFSYLERGHIIIYGWNAVPYRGSIGIPGRIEAGEMEPPSPRCQPKPVQYRDEPRVSENKVHLSLNS